MRGVNYHVRTWGNPEATRVFLLHGSQDVSAAWQFTIDAMQGDWYFLAPDWPGFGLSDWSGGQSYWQPDYVADLHHILKRFSPDEPALLMTHSLGGNIASVYGGLKPERVRKLVNIEGYNVPSVPIEHTTKRYEAWLENTEKGYQAPRSYPSYAAFAERMRKANPRLNAERALYLAQHWCKETPGGGVVLRADPAHARSSPISYLLEEQLTYWRRVIAPTLWVEGGLSDWLHILLKSGEYEVRKAAFRDLTIERFENAAHNIHHEEPERLAQVCEAFLLRP